ncbi:hypothetical protein [Thermogemmatispora sp.]|uniref:TolB family protein n=1 Tax=Thermogemmatispora sp. TaxID=1968838 RepID=UPI0035E419C4
MKRKERPDSSSCPLSIHCLRLLDELDEQQRPERARSEPTSSSPHSEEAELVGRLRRHLPECQICAALVAEARHERDQQRQLLRQFLEEAERRTPSTQELILRAIRSGQAPGERAAESLAALNHADHGGQNHHRHLPLAVLSRLPESTSGPLSLTRPARRSPLVETLALVAVILLVLISTGSLGYLLLLRPSTQTPASSQPTAISLKATYQSLAWKAVLMVDSAPDSAGRYPLYNYDPFSGQKHLVTTSCCEGPSAVDGIAHSGRDLLYHEREGQTWLYRTLSHPSPLFRCLCNNISAVWTTDDRYVLINADQTLYLVDLLGTSKLLYTSPMLADSRLLFYYNDFLFLSRQEGKNEVLYRLDLASGEQHPVAVRPLESSQQAGISSHGRSSWLLSPTGSTIYYSAGSGLKATLYTVNSDGSQSRPLGRQGIPLGFAEDNRLLFLQEVRGAFEVKKLGSTPQEDQLVVVNAAPGADNVLADEVALAPYGWALLTEALYPDHSLRLWATDLTTHAQKLLLSLPASMVTRGNIPQLVGWDQLAVGPTATPTPSTAQIPAGTMSAADDWNGLLLLSSTQDGQISVSNYNYATGQLQTLLSGLPSQTEIDGISPDGSLLAYHVPDTAHTNYYVVDLRATPPLMRFQYESAGGGGNAIWLSAQTLLINAPSALLQVNILRPQPKAIMPSLPNARLVFYSAPYLYFAQSLTEKRSALFRLPLGETSTQGQAITPAVAATDFWLSPDGRTIYYASNQSGSAGIYAVDSDGSNGHLLRPWGVPIGYAADNSLVVMRYHQGNFEVVKLGLAPLQDEVLLENAAPGAAKLCDTLGGDAQATSVDQGRICKSAVALAPYGHHLVVQAHYADGHATLLAYDLDTGQQLSAQTTPTSRLVGYNRYPPA